MHHLKAVIIIPARYGSTRLPGKPLLNIGNKIMIQRVYERAKKLGYKVYVATEDERIQKAVEKFNGHVIMTPINCQNGTERCLAAWNTLSEKTKKNTNVILNIQGDEPFFPLEACQKMIQSFAQTSTDIATLISPIQTTKAIFDPHTVKVVMNKAHFAQYFSRSPIPYIMHTPKMDWLQKATFFKHIGLYAFRPSIFEQLPHLSPTTLEKVESLEQNRWLSHGYNIRLIKTSSQSLSVDTPKDWEAIKQWKDQEIEI